MAKRKKDLMTKAERKRITKLTNRHKAGKKMFDKFITRQNKLSAEMHKLIKKAKSRRA